MIKTLKRATDIRRGDCVVLSGIRHVVTSIDGNSNELFLQFEGYHKQYKVTRGKYLVVDEADSGCKFAFQLLDGDVVFFDDGGQFKKAFTVKRKTRKGKEVVIEVYEMARQLTVPADSQLEKYNGSYIKDKPIQDWKEKQGWAEYRMSQNKRW